MLKSLPNNAQHLISEYSKPLTRPDWRSLQRLTFYSLYSEVIQRRTRKRSVLSALYKTIHNGHTISGILYYITYYDTYLGSIVLDMPEIVLGDIALYFQPFINNDEDFIFKYRY
jgi:hypothetical protein